MSMIKLPRDYGMAAVLLALAGVLLVVAAGEWLHFRSVRADLTQRLALKSAGGDDSPVNTATIADTPALESYEEMVARPLFLQSRRPPSEDAQEETPAAPEPKTPLNAKLMGVILTPTGKIALLVDEKGKYKRGRKNTLIDGWKLVDIKEDRVTLEQAGEHKDLPLLKPKPKTGAPPPTRTGGKVSVKGPDQPEAGDEDTGNEPDTAADEESDVSEDEDTQTDEASDEEE